MKRCRHCRQYFQAFNSLEVVCSVGCSIAYARAHPEKVSRLRRNGARVEKREGRERLKSRRDYVQDAQRAVNAYCRERDAFDGCISCDMPSNYGGRWHAGHYRTTAAAPQLRFNEDNIHKQCAQCNTSKSGNTVEYRKRLIVKIGVVRVEALENDNAVSKRDIDELKAIRKLYQTKLRDLRARREMWGAVA
jgi:hypothetical protein